MKITRRQLRRIIRETIETHPRLGDADGDGTLDFADATPYSPYSAHDAGIDTSSGLFVVIANYPSPHRGGRAKQSLWPNTGSPELYSKEEADQIVADRVKKEKRKDGGGDFVWFAKPIETAHNWTLGYAGDVIARLQSERG